MRFTNCASDDNCGSQLKLRLNRARMVKPVDHTKKVNLGIKTCF